MRRNPLVSIILSCSLCALLPLVLCPSSARSQGTGATVSDCAGALPIPAGAEPAQAAECSQKHAQFLFAQVCGVATTCTAQNVIAAYRTASRLHDRYLESRDLQLVQSGKPPVNDSVHARDTRWTAFLQERSRDFGNAEKNYQLCTQLANGAHDTEDLNLCASSLNRLYCVIRFNPDHCSSAPSAPTVQDAQMDSKPVAPAKSDTVEVTIKSSGGGHTGIVIDSPVTESPANPQAPTRPPSITSSVVITLPPDSEVNDLKNSMTAVEKQGLQRTLEQQGISVSVDASAVH